MPLRAIIVIQKMKFSKHFPKFSSDKMTNKTWLSDTLTSSGVQGLSGRVLDSRPRGRGFEPHRRHCVVVLDQDTFILA